MRGTSASVCQCCGDGMSLCLLLCVSARRGGMLCLSLSLSVIAAQKREGISLFQCESVLYRGDNYVMHLFVSILLLQRGVMELIFVLVCVSAAKRRDVTSLSLFSLIPRNNMTFLRFSVSVL